MGSGSESQHSHKAAAGENPTGDIKLLQTDADGNLLVATLINFVADIEVREVGYEITDVDDDASPNYYGYVDAEGNWYIMKEVVSAGANTYRYASGTSGYTTAWTGRAGLSYNYYDVEFG